MDLGYVFCLGTILGDEGSIVEFLVVEKQATVAS